MMMKKAFTLSEVLVTLGIVAIVSALTIPSIVSNYKYKMYGAQIEKVYGQISDAARSMMSEEMSGIFSQTTGGSAQTIVSGQCKTGACYFLKNYFKVAKDNCKTEDTVNGVESCLPDTYYYKDPTTGAVGSAGNITSQATYCIQTVSSATICIAYNTANGVSSVFVDINGKDEPNMVGYDAYIMDIDKTDGTVRDWRDDPARCGTRTTSYGFVADYAQGCLSKVMQNGWVVTD